MQVLQLHGFCVAFIQSGAASEWWRSCGHVPCACCHPCCSHPEEEINRYRYAHRQTEHILFSQSDSQQTYSDWARSAQRRMKTSCTWNFSQTWPEFVIYHAQVCSQISRREVMDIFSCFFPLSSWSAVFASWLVIEFASNVRIKRYKLL